MSKASNRTALIITKAVLTVLLIIPLLSIVNLFSGMPVDEIFGLDVPFPVSWLTMLTEGLYYLASWYAPVALPAIVCGLAFPILLIITMVKLYVKPKLLLPSITLGYFILDFVWEIVLFCLSAKDNPLSLCIKLYALTFIFDAAVIIALTAYIVLFRKYRDAAAQEEQNE